MSSSTRNLLHERYFPPSEPRAEIGPFERTGSKVTISETDLQEANLPRQLGHVEESLGNISQLGLKEIWLGEKPGWHNRWIHSIGTMNAGLIWMKVLKDTGAVPTHCLPAPTNTWPKVFSFVGTALLLHDYGHLPFSHLTNEVLESINWLPNERLAGGLEAQVLSVRAREDTWKNICSDMLNRTLGVGMGAQSSLSCADVSRLLLDVILGRHPSAWMQAIVNSPIDADKIDYIAYDDELLQKVDFPIRSRLLMGRPSQWLADFLREQRVNHSGLLCLDGRSAEAAVLLWRERVSLYDSFYFAPVMRVPERIAFEIIQQYAIRSTISTEFRSKICNESGESFSAVASNRGSGNGPGIMPIETKFEIVLATLMGKVSSGGTTLAEFPVLQEMAGRLQSFNGIDAGYRGFLNECFHALTDLKESRRSAWDLVQQWLVREPLCIPRNEFEHAREILRPLQHRYCRDALIDMVRMPHVLGAPARWRTAFAEGAPDGLDHTILVPDGPIATWGTGKRAVRPLRDNCVEQLERRFARIIVIAPNGRRSAKAEFVWDRVRASLLDANIQVVAAGSEMP